MTDGDLVPEEIVIERRRSPRRRRRRHPSERGPGEIVATTGARGGPRRRRADRGRPGRSSRRRRRLLIAGGVIGVAATLLVVNVMVRYLPALNALQDGRDAVVEVQSLIADDLSHLDRDRVQQAETLLERARADFGARSSILQDGWLMGVASLFPLLGDQVRAVQGERRAGEAASRLGTDLIPLLADVTAPGAGDLPVLTRATRVVAEHGDAVAHARQDLRELADAVSGLPSGWLAGPLDGIRASLRDRTGTLTRAGGPALQLAEVAPQALAQGRHAYLVLLTNPAEQRPGGGFISALGTVTFENGVLQGTAFQRADLKDDLVQNVPAPSDLDRHLYRGHPWDLGDANWSADFPTSVRDVLAFYTREGGAEPDGVIAVDAIAVQRLLSVVGDVTVEPYPQTLTAENALTELNYIANEVRPEDPGKDYLTKLGPVLFDRLVHAELGTLIGALSQLHDAADGRHLVFSFRDGALQRLADDAGFAGRVTATDNDSLLVADANLSATKGDLYVDRSFSLKCDVHPDGGVDHRLTLTYRNHVPAEPAAQKLVVETHGEYRDLVHVFLPQSAQLGNVTLTTDGRHAPVSPESITSADGRMLLTFWLVMPNDSETSLTIEYGGQVSDADQGAGRYQLRWQKELNSLDPAISVEITGARGRIAYHGMLDGERSWGLG